MTSLIRGGDGATSGRWLRVLVALVVLAGTSTVTGAAEPPLVLEKFQVDPDDDWLLLPVTIETRPVGIGLAVGSSVLELPGKPATGRHLFALDTGASHHLFDLSLRSVLGQPQGAELNVTTASGIGATSLEMFDAPTARLGNLSLRSLQPVGCVDLARLREASWTEIHGIIGMPLLATQVVEIDPDAHTVRFLDRVDPAAAGTPVPLRYNDMWMPEVDVDLPGIGRRPMIVDTGDVGSGSVAQADFDRLLQSGAIREPRTRTARDLASSVRASSSCRATWSRSTSRGERCTSGRRASSADPTSPTPAGWP
jgi:hypothetical protein